MKSKSTTVIKEGIERLGHSVQKAFPADRLRQLPKKEGK